MTAPGATYSAMKFFSRMEWQRYVPAGKYTMPPPIEAARSMARFTAGVSTAVPSPAAPAARTSVTNPATGGDGGGAPPALAHGDTAPASVPPATADAVSARTLLRRWNIADTSRCDDRFSRRRSERKRPVVRRTASGVRRIIVGHGAGPRFHPRNRHGDQRLGVNGHFCCCSVAAASPAIVLCDPATTVRP